MASFEEDRLLERNTSALIDYFKLIYLKMITADNMDAFKTFGGEELSKRLQDNLKDENVWLNPIVDNDEITKKLGEYIEQLFSSNISISPVLLNELKQLGWLKDCVKALSPDDTIASQLFQQLQTINKTK